MKSKRRNNDAAFEWVIEPYRQSVDGSPIFHAVKVAPGTGRYHTRGQAGHAASIASGHVIDEFDARLANEIGVIRRSQMRQERRNGTRHKAKKTKTTRRLHGKKRRTSPNGGKDYSQSRKGSVIK